MSSQRVGRFWRVTVAHAHTQGQAYVYLYLTGLTLTGSLHLPLNDLEKATGETYSNRTNRAQLDFPTLQNTREYAAQHFSIWADRTSIDVEFPDAEVRMLASGGYLFLRFEAPRHKIARPVRLEVGYDAVIESLDDRDAVLIVNVSRGWGRLHRYQESLFAFNKEQRTHTIDIQEPTAVENLAASVRQGKRIGLARLKRLIRRLGNPEP